MKLFKFFSISFSLFIFLFGFVSVNVVNADITYSTTTPKGVPVTTGTLKIGGAHSGSLSDPFQIGDTITASGTAYCKADNCYQSSINATMIRADHQWEKANPWVNFYKDVYTTVNTITMSSFKSNTIGEYSKYYFNLHGETSFTVPFIPGDYEMSFGVFNNGDTKHFSIPFTVTPPPVNCVGSWSTCSDGSHTFTISTPAANGGATCNPAVNTTESCGTVGYWGDWSNWGSCSVSSCGQTGTQGRTRSCIGPYGGGAPCVGDTSESQACSTAACDVTPPSGTLTGSDCVIDEGKNSCTTTLILAITNPVTGKATNITKPADIEVAKGITPASKPGIVVKYPSETFYLNHNEQTLNLDGTKINASCDATKNLVWDATSKTCKYETFTVTSIVGDGGSITTNETTPYCKALSTNGNVKTYKKDCSVLYNIIPDTIHDIKNIYFDNVLRYSIFIYPDSFSYSRSNSTYVGSGNPSFILTDYRKSSVSIYGDVKYHSSARATFKMDKDHTTKVDFACLNNSPFIDTCARVNVDGPGVLTAKPGEDRNVSYNVQTTTNAGTECRVLDNNKKELEGDSGVYKTVTKGNEYGASMSGITIPNGDGPYLYYIQCRDRITTDAIGLASVTINTKVGNCINGVCGDACGTGSGTTPQLIEPTQSTKDYKACEVGTLNSSNPADTTTSKLQAWNWSCGTVTTCSTPKFGCRIITDSNYDLSQYGANGPDNNYGCAGTCENGANKSTWPTCTVITPTCFDRMMNQDETSVDTGGVCGSGDNSCGTANSGDPKDPEPTGVAACSSGTKLNSPADTTASWNWSCGTDSCSTPKMGCRIDTDTNYKGAISDNDWACDKVCKNGADKSTWPSCTTGGCVGNNCPPTNGVWSDWFGQVCGNGTGTKTRYCSNPANGGLPCLNSYGNPATQESISYIQISCPPDVECKNGANNPPTCTIFPPCTNGANNPPTCTTCLPSQNLISGKCVNKINYQEN